MTHRMVCDTSAIVACGLDEPGAAAVRAQLSRGGCVMHSVFTKIELIR